jgi:hypothetical protein
MTQYKEDMFNAAGSPLGTNTHDTNGKGNGKD